MSTRRAVKPLSPADMEVLEFARTLWGPKIGPKEAAVSERFAIRGGRPLVIFNARLHRILSDPAADVYDPELVRRLRRIRDHKRALRNNPGRAS